MKSHNGSALCAHTSVSDKNYDYFKIIKLYKAISVYREHLYIIPFYKEGKYFHHFVDGKAEN